MLKLFSSSVRMRMVALTSLILFVAAAFMAVFFPSRVGDVLRQRMEERVTSLAQLAASAIAPGVEFDDKTNVQEALEGFRLVADFEFAQVRRANGTVLASLNPERVPSTLVQVGEQPVLSHVGGVLRLDRQVRGKSGVTGTLTLGFSLSSVRNETRTQTQVVVLVSALVFVLGIAANFIIGTVLVRPIGLMTQVALRIASGDLSQSSLGVFRSDEVGKMAAAFDRMLQLLRTLAQVAERVGRGDLAAQTTLEGQVGQAIRQMIEGQRGLVRQIADAAMKLGGATAQIHSVMQEQEGATAKQAGGVEEVSRTMQSLLDSAGNIADSARGVFDNAQKTRQTTDGMSGHVQTLFKHTARIAELLEVIRDIADRSDLLALNASLEATRAGDAGRAFALVAAEMRRLAERITASVVDVKSLLVDIRTSAASTASATDDGRQLAEGTTESARQITMVTQQQRTATGQVLESMREISSVLGVSVTSMREIRASSEMLRKTAEHLNEVVGQFKIEG